jgi:2-methylcitrate dehydratase PrpD
MSRGCTEQLVNHVLGARWDAFPDSARAATRTFILDSIGVGISGSRVATATMVKTAARGWGEGSDARIWNTGEAVPATTAALVNGFQIHNQEWDCVHERAVVHPMAVILAALIAFAERSGRRKQAIDGKTLMLATAIAVDVATTLGMCAVQPMRFFRPAMCGAFGAAAGIAVLRGSNAAELRNASLAPCRRTSRVRPRCRSRSASTHAMPSSPVTAPMRVCAARNRRSKAASVTLR